MSDSENYWQRVQHSRTGRRRLLQTGAVGVAGLGAAWLAACGGGSDKSDSPSGSGGGQAQSTVAAGVQPTNAPVSQEGTPKPGGTLTWREIGIPPLDPTNNPTYRAQVAAGFTYSRLIKFKTGPTPEVGYNYDLEPDLADKWEIANEGLQYTFKLKANVKFHNKPPVNARVLDSGDVKASFERFRAAPKNTNKNAFGSDANKLVESLETPDPLTVVVKLAKPYAPILNIFANPQYLWIQPKEIDSGFNPDKEQIGTGPFILGEVQPDASVSYKKNPQYFLSGRPYIDESKQVVIPDTAQNVAQFQAGRLDVAGIPASLKSDVEKTNPKSQVVTYIPTTYYFISPQQRANSVFKDVRIRRALSHAIDRESWLKLRYLGFGSAYTNAVPASMGKWWLDPKKADAGPGAAWYKYDPKASRDLLKAAGQENMNLRFIYTNNAYGDEFNSTAEATASMLKEAGFNVQIVIQDYNRDYIDAKGTFFGNYEGIFYGLQTPFTDPHDYLFNMNHPSSARNHAGINDDKLTMMIDDEQKTTDEPSRVKKVQDIQRYWMDNMFYIPIAVGYDYSFRQPWLKRYYYTPTYGAGIESMSECWIDKS
jgi:peptide/nickel transport system substrate-binding protein